MRKKIHTPVAPAWLVALVQRVVDESGDPAGFDASAWATAWVAEPCPALGGRCPGDYLQTEEGQAMISRLILQMQSGAYA